MTAIPLWEPPPWHPAAQMMAYPCGVGDVIGQYRLPVHDRIARAIATHIGLGVWCDAFAWYDVVDHWAIWSELYGGKRKVAAEEEQWELEL